MFGQNPFTEEGRTRWRNFERRLAGYLIVALILGALTGFGFFRLWTRPNLAPLQKLYLMQYALGSIKAAVSERAMSKYKLLTYQVTDANGKTATGGVTDAQVHPVRDTEGRPVRNESGFVFAWNASRQGELSWRKVKVNDRQMVALLRDHNYEEESFFGLLIPSTIAGLIAFLTGAVGLIVYDQRLNKKYEEGKFLRGTRLVQPEKFKLEAKSPGLGVPSLSMKKRGFWRSRRKKDRIYWLQVPREEEAAHATLLGDTGTGKSQLIHLFLWQIAQRRPAESVIIYDPAGEFVSSHFVAERGDIVLNHPTTPIEDEIPAPTRILVTDPCHPLCGQSFTILGVINRRPHGRCFIVRLPDGFDRYIPVKATDQAKTDEIPFPLPLCPASLTNLLSAYARFSQLWKEHPYATQSQTGGSGSEWAALPTGTAVDEDT